MTLLKIVRVTKKFGGIIALDNVSLDIERGSFLGLIGPNGSGKTTLVNVVTGVFKPESGKIYFKGVDITGKPPHIICRYGLARTFQIPQPLPDMTVYENVLLASKFCGDGNEERVWEVIGLCGLEDKAFTETEKLTLIEKRMLELARALSTNPELVFLDEVAAGLRPGEINKLGSILNKLNKEGLTIVWIEHNVAELIKYVKSLIVMSQGRIIAQGSPEEVVKSPEVIKSYLGRLALA